MLLHFYYFCDGASDLKHIIKTWNSIVVYIISSCAITMICPKLSPLRPQMSFVGGVQTHTKSSLILHPQ